MTRFVPAQSCLLPPLRFWGNVALGSLLAATVMGATWQELLDRENTAIVLRGTITREAAAATARAAARPATSQKIREAHGVITADYGFVNFNNDQLTISFSIPSRELAAYRLDYGYTAAERGAIDQWQKSAVAEAYQYAVKNRQSQEQLNRAGEKIAAEYRTRLANFFKARGFSLLEGNLLIVDIPEIVRRNVRKTRGVALSLNASGEKRGYDSDSIIAAALAFIQTAVQYENVPQDVKGRQTGGIYPPLETLASGKGDCDTKTALLAAILLNWNRVKIVGVGVPGHYLMGILRNPAKGDAFVEYQGGKYVLVEPAGPGWLVPGSVDRRTMALLNAADKVRIEPLTAN
jgi:hypothetical protein